MTTTSKPSRFGGVAELSAAGCRSVLERNHVGRIAYLWESRVDIEPVSYAFAGNWIFLRSAAGTKMNALAHAPYVAFEVDEIKSVASWQSVVAHGTVYLLSDRGDRADRGGFERAVRALRSFLPQTFRADDPVPFRDTVYGIHVDRLTGRTARSTRVKRAKRKTVRRTRSPSRRGHTADGF